MTPPPDPAPAAHDLLVTALELLRIQRTTTAQECYTVDEIRAALTTAQQEAHRPDPSPAASPQLTLLASFALGGFRRTVDLCDPEGLIRAIQEGLDQSPVGEIMIRRRSEGHERDALIAQTYRQAREHAERLRKDERVTADDLAIQHRPPAASPLDDIHTGDDDLLDALTGIRAAIDAALDEFDGDRDEARLALRDALEECTKADKLRVAELTQQKDAR